MNKTCLILLLCIYPCVAAFAPSNIQNEPTANAEKNQGIEFNLTYDASSIEKLFTATEEVLKDISGFWETENAYRLIKGWHRYNKIPIDYEGWKEKIEEIAAIPSSQRRDDPGYRLANEIIGAKEMFIQKAVPHICSFLPEITINIESTAFFVAFTYPRGIGVGDRIAIDIFSSHYRRSSSMILNTMVHELYHVGFGQVQFARTDPEFEKPAVRRMLSDFQNEGITTYVAYKAQALFPAQYEKDYTMLENTKTVFKLLKSLNTLFEEAESMPEDQLQKKSWNLGVEERAYYIVGAYMAQTIDEKRGREALNETVQKGPVTFIRTYNALVDKKMQIFEIETPADMSVFERLRQAAVHQDYKAYKKRLTELKEKNIEISRSKEDILLRIGQVFLQRNRSDLAIEIFMFDAKLFPESAAAYNFLGKAYLQNGNLRIARESFKRAVELDPEYVDAVENLKKVHE